MMAAPVAHKDCVMTELSLRDARSADQAAISDLTLAAYQEYAAAIPALWESYRDNTLATLAEVAPAEQIVAELDGALVGTVLLFPAGSVVGLINGVEHRREWPEIRLLAVAPAMRGRGVGSALVRECLRRARQSGAAVLTLHTTDLMQVAMQMYERLGFVRAEDLDFHPAPDFIIKGYRYALDADAPAAV